MTDKPQFIYHVTGAAGDVVYVGVSYDAEHRLRQHVYIANHYRRFVPCPFHAWLLSEIAAGRSFNAVVVRPADPTDPLADERREIIRMRDAGAKLLNAVVKGTHYRRRFGGGDGFVSVPVRDLMSTEAEQ